jgi:hypothetical protein
VPLHLDRSRTGYDRRMRRNIARWKNLDYLVLSRAANDCSKSEKEEAGAPYHGRVAKALISMHTDPSSIRLALMVPRSEHRPGTQSAKVTCTGCMVGGHARRGWPYRKMSRGRRRTGKSSVSVGVDMWMGCVIGRKRRAYEGAG